MAPLEAPLTGLRVLETGGELGAWCGKLLADMGATVVKVEPREGERSRGYEPFYEDRPDPNRSLFFWHYNTSKRGVTLDLQKPAGRDLFRELADWAEVVIDSHPPGYLKGLGLGYEALREAHPALVMCGITPFGQEGPYHDWAMTDLTMMAFGGPAWSCGYDDHSLPPVRPGGNNGYETTCHFAMMGIMAALLYRDHAGVGQYIDTNAHACQNVTTEAGSHNYLVAKQTVQRMTGRHAMVGYSPPQMLKCADGRYLSTGGPVRSPEQWQGMLALLDEEGLTGDLRNYPSAPNRNAAVAGDKAQMEQLQKLAAAQEALAARKSAYELFIKCQNINLQWGVIYYPEDVLSDPHFVARGFPVQVEHPELGKTFTYPGAPVKFTKTPWRIFRRAPLLGEDNEVVYRGFIGLAQAEYESLIAGSVI